MHLGCGLQECCLIFRKHQHRIRRMTVIRSILKRTYCSSSAGISFQANLMLIREETTELCMRQKSTDRRTDSILPSCRFFIKGTTASEGCLHSLETLSLTHPLLTEVSSSTTELEFLMF